MDGTRIFLEGVKSISQPLIKFPVSQPAQKFLRWATDSNRVTHPVRL